MTARPAFARLLAAGVLLSSCAGPAAQRTTTARPSTAARRPGADATGAEPWAAVMLPELTSPGLVERDDDGSYLATLGTLRVRVRGDEVELAHDATLLPMRGHARGEGGHWFFVSQDGGFFRADSYTGPLTRVAESGRVGIAGGFVGLGVVAVRDDHRALWLGRPDDGSFAPARLEGEVIDAGFVDARFGVAITAPGLLYRTTDGGRTFERIDLGLDAAYEVIPVPAAADGAQPGTSGTFGVVTADGVRTVGPAGAPTPAPNAPAHMGSRLPEEAWPPLLRALFARFPYADRAVVLADERTARVVEHEVVVRAPGASDEAHAQRFALPDDDDTAGCRLYAWGSRLLATCARRPGIALYSWSGGRTWAMLREFAEWGEVFAGEDGAGIAVTSACEQHAQYNGRRAVCAFDGTEWRTRYLPAESTLLSVRADALLYVEPSAAADGTPQTVVRLLPRGTRNDGRPVPLDDPDAELRYAAFTPDGLVVGVAENDDRRFTAVGRPGASTLALRPLPEGAEQVAFVDERRGIAVGRNLGRVWTTVDGAQSWTQLALPVDGDPASVEVVPARRRPVFFSTALAPRVRCRQRACQIGERVLWAPTATANELARAVTVRAAAHAPPPAPSTERDLFSAPAGMNRANDWRCELSSTRPLASGVRGSETAIAGPGGVVVVQAADASGTARVALRWSGSDERGVYQASARPGALALPQGATPGGPARWIPRFLGREMLLIERCITGARDSACELVVARRGAPPRSLGAPGALIGEVAQEHGVVLGALALPGGGAVVHVSTEFMASTDADFDAVVQLDARGAISANRRYAWPPRAGTRALARDGTAGPGLVLTAPDAARAEVYRPVFYPAASGAGPRPLGELRPNTEVRACAGTAPDPSALALSVSGYGAQLSASARVGAPGAMGLYLGESSLRSVIEWGPGRAPCLRALELWTPSIESDRAGEALVRLGGVPVIRASNGDLGGTLVGASAAGGTLRCTQQ